MQILTDTLDRWEDSESLGRKRRVLSYGAILSDVDGTLLQSEPPLHGEGINESTLTGSPAALTLVELLVRGFRICVVTGNDFEKFTRRFLEPLRTLLAKRRILWAIQNLEIYANGAATHFTIDSRGHEHPDDDYNDACRIPASDGAIIVEVLARIAEEDCVHHLSDRAAFERDYDCSRWGYRYDASCRRWYEEVTVTRRFIPWVEERGDGAMVTLKPLPSHKHLRRVDAPDIRAVITEKVRAELARALGRRFDHYEVMPGGRSSIDVTARITKANAVEHYLARHGFKPEEVIYLGDEFRPRGGNDQPVVDAFPTIHAISVNQSKDEIFFSNTIVYGGARGIHSTAFQLEEILELHAVSEAVLNRVDEQGVVPAIRQKIWRDCEAKVTEREQFLRHMAAKQNVCIVQLRQGYIGLLNEAIRGLGATAASPLRLVEAALVDGETLDLQLETGKAGGSVSFPKNAHEQFD